MSTTPVALLRSEPAASADEPVAGYAEIFIDRVREDLGHYLERTGKSQATAARAIGMSDTVVSQFLSGKYPAKGLAIARTIDAWLVLQAQRDLAPREPRFVETENAIWIQEGLELAHEMGAMALIYGVAGSGKSRVAAEYKRQKGETAILLVATPTIRSPHGFLQTLAEKIKSPTGFAVKQLQDEIESRLRGSNRLLIVDEAERLSFRTIETIQSIHDETKIGVAMLADEVLWVTISDGRRRAEYERFISRSPIKRAVNPVISRADVARIAVQYLGHTDEECMAYLHAKAQGVGGFRAVVHYAWQASRYAQAEKRPVELRDLKRTAATFGDLETVQRAVARK